MTAGAYGRRPCLTGVSLDWLALITKVSMTGCSSPVHIKSHARLTCSHSVDTFMQRTLSTGREYRLSVCVGIKPMSQMFFKSWAIGNISMMIVHPRHSEQAVKSSKHVIDPYGIVFFIEYYNLLNQWFKCGLNAYWNAIVNLSVELPSWSTYRITKHGSFFFFFFNAILPRHTNILYRQ